MPVTDTGCTRRSTVAPDEEDRNVPESPGDVVDEDVVGSVDERRPHDRMRHAEFTKQLLGSRLPAEVRKGEASSGFATLMWTMRLTPARCAAPNSAAVLRTALSKVVSPRSNRTQYVL